MSQIKYKTSENFNAVAFVVFKSGVAPSLYVTNKTPHASSDDIMGHAMFGTSLSREVH